MGRPLRVETAEPPRQRTAWRKSSPAKGSQSSRRKPGTGWNCRSRNLGGHAATRSGGVEDQVAALKGERARGQETGAGRIHRDETVQAQFGQTDGLAALGEGAPPVPHEPVHVREVGAAVVQPDLVVENE